VRDLHRILADRENLHSSGCHILRRRYIWIPGLPFRNVFCATGPVVICAGRRGRCLHLQMTLQGAGAEVWVFRCTGRSRARFRGAQFLQPNTDPAGTPGRRCGSRIPASVGAVASRGCVLRPRLFMGMQLLVVSHAHCSSRCSLPHWWGRLSTLSSSMARGAVLRHGRAHWGGAEYFSTVESGGPRTGTCTHKEP
jgi:hypothetical protein